MSAARAWSWRTAPTGERPGTSRRSRRTTGSAERAATPRCRGTRTATSSWRGSTSRTRAPSRSRSAPTGAGRSSMIKVLRPNPPTARAGTDDGPRRQGRGRRGRGGEAGRRREGARAEPEGVVRRPADDRGGRRIRLAHVEQQRHHAGVRGARVRVGAGREVLQASGHPEEPELQLRRYRDRPAGSGLRGLHEGQGRNAPDGRHHPRRHRPGRVGSEGVHTRQAHRDDQRAAVRRHHAAAFAHGRRRDRPGVGHGSHEPALRAPLPAVDRRAAEREQRHGHLAPLLGRRRRHVERTRPGQRRGDERPVPPAHRARSHDREPGVRLARRP